MEKANKRILVTWLILAYDREADRRFPLERKWYRFNSDRASSIETQAVLRLVKCNRHEVEQQELSGFEETQKTIRLGGNNYTSREILKYRHLFDLVQEEEPSFEMGKVDVFLNVSLAPDSYFEDECERPMTLVQICDEELGREVDRKIPSVVLGHPESILRLGPSTPIRPEQWTHHDADLVFHLKEKYIEVVRSRWLQSECVVSSIGKGPYLASFPVQEDCMAVILPFRQLYSQDGSDDLFNRCCKIHKRHCSSEHPSYEWVNRYKKHFNDFLRRRITFPVNTTLSATRYLDAFAYGAKVIHATSRKNDPENDLEMLLKDHGREMVIMGYHYILRQLLNTVSMVLPVLVQNVDHWISDHGWPGSRPTSGRCLFGG